MKKLKLPLLCCGLFWGTAAAQAQGTFQNLGFESAIVPAYGGLPILIPFTDALPGWTGFRGSDLAAQAAYNGVSLGFAAISIIDHGYTESGDLVIGGNYTAALSAGFGPPTGFVATAISQSSLTPITAKSLRFSALFGDGVASDLAISMNGQNIPFYQLTAGSTFQVQIYGGDISAFAGLIEELRFTEQPISHGNVTVFLDNIEFSNQPIPEPGTVALFGLASLLLGWRILRKR